jgi:hypothetical protein
MDSSGAGAPTRRVYRRFFPEYRLFAVLLAVIAGWGFALSPVPEIWRGLQAIITSRSLLITDYSWVGGPGAMLVNGALAGGLALLLMFAVGVKPNGAIIMALWMTVGFGFFGKNVLNMLPLMGGVWLYAKVQREPFINFSLASLLVATLSPLVSEIAFGFDPLHPFVGLALAVLAGVAAGFFFPMVSAFSIRVHDGYNLYNMGFAGGLIALFFVAGLKGMDVDIEAAALWATGFDAPMAGLILALSAMLIGAGFILGRGRDHAYGLKRILKSSGRLVSDYYTLYGPTAYINMGLLGIFGVIVTLLLGIDVNGPVMGGIFTLIGFGAFGKHLRNVAPVIAGAAACAFLNTMHPTAPGNALAILFSPGLTPIAGQFGPVWGFLAGFIHVGIVIHAGVMSNGLNLYNNGFAAGLVAVVMVPVILSLKKARK